MFSVTQFRASAMVLAAPLLVHSSSLAISVPLDTFVSPAGTSLGERPELAGTVIDERITPIELVSESGFAAFRGQLINQVVRASNSQTLDFYFRFVSGLDRPVQLGLASFDMIESEHLDRFTVDADFRMDLGGFAAPFEAAYLDGRETNQEPDVHFGAFSRTAGPDLDPDSTLDLDLDTGEATNWFFVRTNAMAYSFTGNLHMDFASVWQVPDEQPQVVMLADNFRVFRPTVIPLPAPMLSGTIALAGLLAVRTARPFLQSRRRAA